MSQLREIVQEAYDTDTELNRMNTEDIDKAVTVDIEQIKALMLELDPDFPEDLKEIWIGSGSLDWKKKAAADRVIEHEDLIQAL